MKKISLIITILITSVVNSISQTISIDNLFVTVTLNDGKPHSEEVYEFHKSKSFGSYDEYYGISLKHLYYVSSNNFLQMIGITAIDLDKLKINEDANGYFISVHSVPIFNIKEWFTSKLDAEGLNERKDYVNIPFESKETAQQVIADIIRFHKIALAYFVIPNHQAIYEPDLSVLDDLKKASSYLDPNGRDLFINAMLDYDKFLFHSNSAQYYQTLASENSKLDDESYRQYFNHVAQFRRTGNEYITKYGVVLKEKDKEHLKQVTADLATKYLDIPQTLEAFMTQVANKK